MSLWQLYYYLYRYASSTHTASAMSWAQQPALLTRGGSRPAGPGVSSVS